MALLADTYATTRENRQRPLSDLITNHNAFLKTIQDQGNVINAAGGSQLHEPLIFTEAADASADWYDGYDVFTPDTDVQNLNSAIYEWKQLGGFSYISGKEEHMNSGKNRAVDLLKAKDDALIATLKNKAAISLYSDGTGSTGQEWGGLQLLVADDPTAAGSPGGIDQAANVIWRNQADVAAAAITAATIQGRMNDMYLATIRGTDAPDLILGDLVTFKAYWESLQVIQRITTISKGAAGFQTLEFMGAPVVYDTACPASHMYFLDCKYLKMRKAPGRWFQDEAPQPIQGADYILYPNWTMSNLTCNNRRLQGVIADST
jgi:hypothetical protein